jgi:hypothetical protein
MPVRQLVLSQVIAGTVDDLRGLFTAEGPVRRVTAHNAQRQRDCFPLALLKDDEFQFSAAFGGLRFGDRVAESDAAILPGVKQLAVGAGRAEVEGDCLVVHGRPEHGVVPPKNPIWLFG